MKADSRRVGRARRATPTAALGKPMCIAVPPRWHALPSAMCRPLLKATNHPTFRCVTFLIRTPRGRTQER